MSKKDKVLKSLSKEEYEELPTPSSEEIQEVMEKVSKDLRKAKCRIRAKDRIAKMEVEWLIGTND